MEFYKMKLWILAFVVSVILVVYSVPTFYDAAIEKRTIKTARIIIKDLIDTRFLCLSTNTEYKVTFITNERYGYSLHNGDKLLKTVYLDQIDANVVYSSLFKSKDLIFKPVRDVNTAKTDGYSSIFLNDRTKESKNDFNSVIQIYINNNSYEIKLYRAYGVKDNGDLIFKEI